MTPARGMDHAWSQLSHAWRIRLSGTAEPTVDAAAPESPKPARREVPGVRAAPKPAKKLKQGFPWLSSGAG